MNWRTELDTPIAETMEEKYTKETSKGPFTLNCDGYREGFINWFIKKYYIPMSKKLNEYEAHLQKSEEREKIYKKALIWYNNMFISQKAREALEKAGEIDKKQ